MINEGMTLKEYEKLEDAEERLILVDKQLKPLREVIDNILCDEDEGTRRIGEG